MLESVIRRAVDLESTWAPRYCNEALIVRGVEQITRGGQQIYRHSRRPLPFDMTGPRPSRARTSNASRFSRSTARRITDSSIQNYLAGLFNAGTETPNTSVLYGVYFPSGMRISLSGGSSCTSFCGYHSNFTYNGMDIKYAVFPYPNCSGCSLSGKTVADMLTIVTSHEIREAVTDSDGTAWWDASGYEADDKCAWHNLYQTTNGGYWVQPEYSNGGTIGGTFYPGPGCVVPR